MGNLKILYCRTKKIDRQDLIRKRVFCPDYKAVFMVFQRRNSGLIEYLFARPKGKGIDAGREKTFDHTDPNDNYRGYIAIPDRDSTRVDLAENNEYAYVTLILVQKLINLPQKWVIASV